MSWILNSTSFYRILIDVHVFNCTDNVTSDVPPATQSRWHKFSSLLNTSAMWETIRNWIPKEEANPEYIGCEHRSDVTTQFHVYPAVTLVCVGIMLVTLILPLLISHVLHIFDNFLKRYRSNINKYTTDSLSKSIKKNDDKGEHEEIEYQKHKKCNDCIRLQSYSRSVIGAAYPTCDISLFLKHTTNVLFVEMDKFLVNRREQSNTPLQSIVSSPRSSRRQMLRTTGRLNSSPSMDVEETEQDPMETAAWLEFQQKIISCGQFVCTIQSCDDVYEKASGDLSKLLCFFQQKSPSFKQTSVANMIVNYTLLLLEKSFHKVNFSSGLRFLHFVPTGSNVTGTKSYEPNQFDVHFVLHCTDFSPSIVMDKTVLDDIPTGKIYLCSNHEQSHRLLKKTGNLTCMSCQEFLTAASEFMDAAIQKLYSETRSVIDRLPFRIQRAATPGIVLSLDTRSVFSFGMSKIRIHMIPSIPLLQPGWTPTTMMYAVPTWTFQDIKHKPPSSRDRYSNFLSNSPVFIPDLTWSISYGRLESLFLQHLAMKFSLSGITSCHLICLQILKSLFTAASKKAILSKGELSSYILQTVMFFILVESQPRQWTFQELPSRFSDAVHFIRRALQTRRLPNFFTNNPYLLKQCPVLQTIPLINRGKQENILSDISSEMADKMLIYMDSKLEETGLSKCLQEEYSEDMWEYEYFLQV